MSVFSCLLLMKTFWSPRRS